MIQTALLPNYAAKYRWQPVVPPFRPRPLARITKRRPLPSQLCLPGMGLSDDSGEDLRPRDGDSAVICREADAATVCAQPSCPNCGGREFDDDGDCTACWEPGVVEVIRRQRLGNPIH